LQQELAREVGKELGEEDGVIGFDPSGFKKCGTESVGVQRQWLGRLGKVDNGQVGIYMSYASRHEYTLVDARLYLPKSWAHDKKRRKKCGVPKEVCYQTRQELALDMLQSNRGLLPHQWITGDDEMGRSSGFRRDLRGLGEQYLLAVPSDTGILLTVVAAPRPNSRLCGLIAGVRCWMSETGPVCMCGMAKKVLWSQRLPNAASWHGRNVEKKEAQKNCWL
jgi:SRSO17 transposase